MPIPLRRTDDIGATARRTLHGHEKPVGLVLRGHFLTEEVQWPIQIGGTAARLVKGTSETWRGINDALNEGSRGLTGGSSLAKLLDRRSQD